MHRVLKPTAAALACALALAPGYARTESEAHRFAAARAEMVETLRSYAAQPGSGAPGGRIADRVLDALAAVPRHALVPERLRRFAYDDRPLPIGRGQTISQPYIVALMTTLLDPQPDHRILEVGTGSGYQAAVLAKLAAHVYTVEIISALARRAARDLEALGFTNVTVRDGDGYKGWPSQAPFDGIIVTAAPDTVPPPLIDQLKPGGRLVMPLEEKGGRQFLVILEKDRLGRLGKRKVIEVRFVPLTRTPR